MDQNSLSKSTKIIDEDDGSVEIQATAHRPDGQTQQVTVPTEVGVLPVRNIVIYPGMVIPLGVGRAKSKRLLEATLPENKVIVTVCQRRFEIEDPTPEDLFQVGTASMVLKLLRMDDSNQSVIVHGLVRVKIEEWLGTEPYLCQNQGTTGRNAGRNRNRRPGHERQGLGFAGHTDDPEHSRRGDCRARKH